MRKSEMCWSKDHSSFYSPIQEHLHLINKPTRSATFVLVTINAIFTLCVYKGKGKYTYIINFGIFILIDNIDGVTRKPKAVYRKCIFKQAQMY